LGPAMQEPRPRYALHVVRQKNIRHPGLVKAVSIASIFLGIICGCRPHVFIGYRLGLQEPLHRDRIVSVAAATTSDSAQEDVGNLWKDALTAERERSELLLAQLQEIESKGELAGARLQEEVLTVRKLYEECAVKWGEDEFQQLKMCNDRLQQGISSFQDDSQRPSSEPSGSGRLDGIGVFVEPLPPVPESDEFALVAGAPHVRVSLPIGWNGLMWGSDLTPLFDDEGARLMVFIVSLPLGLRFATAARPPESPAAPGELIVVDAVSPFSEAENNGIRAGDFVRAVSYMAPEEPDFLSKMLGAPTIKMPSVLKCDGLSVEEVNEALESNADAPDSTLTLLLERAL